jgi:ABC-type transporter Mla MlaB component
MLDRHTYEQLIGEATALYAAGCRSIHIDLRQTQRIEQSGLYALYCVHLIFQGEPLPDRETGLAALRYVTERVLLNGRQPVTLVNVPDHLVPLIRRTGFAFN